jgi:hypothetical protein
MTEDDKTVLEVYFNQNLRKISEENSIKHCQASLENLTSFEEQLYLFSKLYPYYFKKAFSLFYKDDRVINQIFLEGFDVIEKMLF